MTIASVAAKNARPSPLPVVDSVVLWHSEASIRGGREARTLYDK